jgi:hypothetical protein
MSGLLSPSLPSSFTGRPGQGRAGQLRYLLNAGSARVLNLLAPSVALQAEAPRPPGLPFRHADLNLSYVIKETDEQAIARGKRGDATLITKLFFPFNCQRPQDGGHSIVLSNEHYEAMLKDFMAFDPDRNPEEGEHDRRMLTLLRDLPSLDPFLLKDQFEALDISVDPRFLQISKEEWTRIRAFIIDQFARLVEAIYPDDREGQRPLAHRAGELVDQLWRPVDKEKIKNLMNALRVSPERSRDVLYAWKGVIYYEYQYGQMIPRLKILAEWLAYGTAPIDFARADMKQHIEKHRGAFRDKLKVSMHEVRGLIAEYQSSFQDLVAEQPLVGPFIAFLNAAPSKFSTLGIALGRLQHALELWERATGGRGDKRAPAGELLDILAILNQSL